MKKFFSISDNSFYVEDTLKTYKLAAIPLPPDLVKITDEEYNEFMISPSGKIPGYDAESGGMVWNDAPAPTYEEAVATAKQFKSDLMASMRAAIVPLQNGVDLNMATDNEVVLLAAWKEYSVLLNRVDTSTAPDIDWPPIPDANN